MAEPRQQCRTHQQVAQVDHQHAQHEAGQRQRIAPQLERQELRRASEDQHAHQPDLEHAEATFPGEEAVDQAERRPHPGRSGSTARAPRTAPASVKVTGGAGPRRQRRSLAHLDGALGHRHGRAADADLGYPPPTRCARACDQARPAHLDSLARCAKRASPRPGPAGRPDSRPRPQPRCRSPGSSTTPCTWREHARPDVQGRVAGSTGEQEHALWHGSGSSGRAVACGRRQGIEAGQLDQQEGRAAGGDARQPSRPTHFGSQPEAAASGSGAKRLAVRRGRRRGKLREPSGATRVGTERGPAPGRPAPRARISPPAGRPSQPRQHQRRADRGWPANGIS